MVIIVKAQLHKHGFKTWERGVDDEGVAKLDLGLSMGVA